MRKTRRSKWFSHWILCLIAFRFCCVFGHAQEEPYYIYAGKKIPLSPDPDAIVASIKATQSLSEEYPEVMIHFDEVRHKSLGDGSRIIISKANTPPKEDIHSLVPEINAREASEIPHYLLGDLRLVVQDEIIVKFKADVRQNVVEEILRHAGISYERIPSRSETYLITVGDPRLTLSISNSLSNNEFIDYAQPNFLVTKPELKGRNWVAPSIPQPPAHSGALSPGGQAQFPSDQYFEKQWGLENRISDSSMGTKGVDISVRGAWAVTQGSNKINVAVLDERVDTSHLDLQDALGYPNGAHVGWDCISAQTASAGTIAPNSQLPSCSPGQFPSPGDSHGTKVAGVIAASINNKLGIAGVAPHVHLIPIRMGSEQSTSGEWTTDVIASIAVDKAAVVHSDVVNISWFMNPSGIVTDAIHDAAVTGRNGKGIVFVCASGDDGGPIVYPASLVEAPDNLPIIVVGAINSWNQVKTKQSADQETYWASNIGPALSVVAPGVGIVTTIPGTTPSNDYVVDFNGTSSAAPFVAGVAALLLSVHPNLSASQVRDKIEQTAERGGASSPNSNSGWGRVNACRAVGGSGC